MTKRTLTIVVAALVAIAIGVGAGVVSASRHDETKAPATGSQKATGFQMEVRNYKSVITKSNYVDNKPTGLSGADILTEHTVWYDGKDRIGTMALTSVITNRTSDETGEVMFDAVARLGDGDITLVGAFDIVAENQMFQAAITGGTGAYARASGYAVFKQTSGDTSKVKVYLTK